jgi:hypothetical protein
MRRAGWNEVEIEWEGLRLILTAYQLADSFVTRVESATSGTTIGLGIGSTEEDSRDAALENVRRKLSQARCFDLMVGG